MASLSVQHNPLAINVKDWGAQGDGVTDDAAAIQAAINASPVGSAIFFPGNHAIGSTIQLLAGRSYSGPLGMSSLSPTFIQKNGVNLPALLASYEWYNNQAFAATPLQISNIVVDGNSAHNSATHGIVVQGYDSIIEDCLVQSTPGAGIVLTSVTRNGTPSANGAGEMTIRSCKTNNTGSYGIWGHDVAGNLSDNYILDCIVANAGDISINLEAAGGCSIRGNHIYGGQKDGIVALQCFATIIADNYVDGYGYASTPSYVTGITAFLNGPRGTLICGNAITIDREQTDGSHYQYIAITGNSTDGSHAIVSGNHIVGGYVGTSSTTTLVAGAKTPCSPASMDGIAPGIILLVDSGGNAETVTVASTTATTFTPTTNWTNNHSTSYPVVSNKGTAFSTGLVFQTTNAQTPLTVVNVGNRVDAVGTVSFTDSHTTVALSADGTNGAVQLLGPLTVSYSSQTALTVFDGAGARRYGVDTNTFHEMGLYNGMSLYLATDNGPTPSLNIANLGNSITMALGTAGDTVISRPATATLGLNGSLALGQSASSPDPGTGGITATSGTGIARVTPAANITGVILQAGTVNGQIVVVVNESATNTVTFAANATSHVANGTTEVLAVNKSRLFVWTGTLWY